MLGPLGQHRLLVSSESLVREKVAQLDVHVHFTSCNAGGRKRPGPSTRRPATPPRS